MELKTGFAAAFCFAFAGSAIAQTAVPERSSQQILQMIVQAERDRAALVSDIQRLEGHIIALQEAYREAVQRENDAIIDEEIVGHNLSTDPSSAASTGVPSTQ